MKLLISFLIFLISFSISAQDSSQGKKDLQSTKMEATYHLKHELIRELKQSIDLQEFTLSVEIEVDEKKLYKTLGISEVDWQKLQNMQLPGLFVEGKEGASFSISHVSKEDILISLKKVKINIIYYQENYTQDFLTGSLKKITSLNVPNLKENQIEITASLESAPYRSTRAEDVITKAFSKPLDINLAAGPFQNFWNSYYKYILVAVALTVIALGGFLAYSLKGGLGSLAEVIKSKTFTNAGSSPTAPKLQSSPSLERTSHNGDNFESYIQANEYLSAMIEKDSKVFNEIIVLKLMVEDYTSLIVLLDVLNKEKRESFTNNIDKDKKERFKEFIVTRGPSVLKDEGLLKAEAIKMIKLVKVASLAPDELYEIVANDFISTLNSVELGQLIKVSTTGEKRFISEILSPEQLAFLFQNDAINSDDLEGTFEGLSNSEIIDLLIKSTTIRDGKKMAIRREKLEAVYAQVETMKAEILADALGLEQHLRFESLFAQFKQDGLKYLEGMDYEALSMLFPLLTEMMQKELLSSLPELLSERLTVARKKVNAESLKHKGDFYYYLRSLSVSQEVDSSSHLKLAA